ncbi:hypothetical protein AGMMS50284_5550 [Clostridia bacterium]|nr:hypothetical protein AGMMS50284_5550 [Clostridia bacterium]
MESSGFFNSSGGDRVYNATDFAAYFGDLISNGIFYRTADSLKVTAATGMNVTVQPGSAWINGYHYNNSTPLDLPITTANGVNGRVDRVVLRWDNVGRRIYLAILTGVPASIPLQPELTRNSDIWELALANIFVNKGVVNIIADNISDLRLFPDLCGLVNSLVTAVYE